MDKVIKIIKTKVTPICVGHKNVLKFADDIVILGRTEQGIQTNFYEALRIRNIKVNKIKTKLIVVSREDFCIRVAINLIVIQQLNTFNYLAVKIKFNRRHDADINLE